MHKLVSTRFRFILYFNPMILLTDLVSFLRKRNNLFKDITTESGNLQYLTVRERYLKLVSGDHIPHDMLAYKFFVEFMTRTYNIGAYLSKMIDILNYGLLYDMHHGKRGFAEFYKQPSEQMLWVAMRNAFTHWLGRVRRHFDGSSLEYRIVEYLEKTANEGLRRALTDPNFKSDDIVSLKPYHFIDYCFRANKRVALKQPLFSKAEWDNIPLKYKEMMTEELIKSMDLDLGGIKPMDLKQKFQQGGPGY